MNTMILYEAAKGPLASRAFFSASTLPPVAPPVLHPGNVRGGVADGVLEMYQKGLK